ncbi:hypothetical protein ACFC08_20945 [Streptomyces sp. NPDC056112]|uniref:hypothetical protein n=2 Tax=unclassified Streptomyces TaxID=2593676 RepID=UPI0035E31AA9
MRPAPAPDPAQSSEEPAPSAQSSAQPPRTDPPGGPAGPGPGTGAGGPVRLLVALLAAPRARARAVLDWFVGLRTRARVVVSALLVLALAALGAGGYELVGPGGVAPLPGRAVLGGQNLAVTRSSQRAGKAAELITFLTSPQSERCLLDAGFAATRTSAYTDDRVRCMSAPAAAGGSPSAAPTGESTDRMPRDAAGRPGYARGILLPALQRAVSRPRTPLYGAFTQTFTAQLGALFTDDPPSDAVLAGRLDEALRRALPG